MKFSIKCCIGCMSYYTYGDYVYFKNMGDAPNEHNNHFIFNQIPDFHITSPFKLCDDMFESFPKLFFYKIIKNRYNNMSELWPSYQKSMYGEKKMKEWK